MMLNPPQGHYRTLKSYRDSAEYSRASLPKLDQSNGENAYQVRFEGTDAWVECDTPPSKGVAEWLYLDKTGRPIYYWNKENKAITLL